MTEQPHTLFARDYLDRDGSTVMSASLLGAAVVQELLSVDRVDVSFAELRGLPSSYFNELLRLIGNGVGIGSIEQRVRFHFDSILQEQVFQRSLSALRQDAA